MVSTEIEFGGADWIHLAEDINPLPAVMKAAVNLKVT
jgi:hypothetical protein